MQRNSFRRTGIGPEKQQRLSAEKLKAIEFAVEAVPRIELVNNGFAVRCIRLELELMVGIGWGIDNWAKENGDSD